MLAHIACAIDIPVANMGNPASGRTVSSGFRCIGPSERLTEAATGNENIGNHNDREQESAGEII
ncbi:hypothetical protein [Novosphingobium sp. ZW T3_23]|uniref:hypothetical protein n=1 Tax=Novosphingobium sp. ZW T3_23 TaxID=3378084 RepID=UPI003852F287